MVVTFVLQLCLVFNDIDNGTNHTALTGKNKVFCAKTHLCCNINTRNINLRYWYSGFQTFLLHIWGIGCLFLITTVIKKTFMHEGCVPYKTMHPDAECLRKKCCNCNKNKL